MKIGFELTGTTPLLMHFDNIEGSDVVKEWQQDPANKNVSVAGDDRSPPWTWHYKLYHDGEKLVIPGDNMLRCLCVAGTRVKIPGAKGKTFKESTQTGITFLTEYLDFTTNGKTIPIADIAAIREKPFTEQCKAIESMGFRLFLKRAKIGTSKHVRVRPRFDSWKVRGTATITANELGVKELQTIFQIAGSVGLGDWRPTAPKSPGPYGQFTSIVKEM